jgi:hypothetical protein
MTSSVRYLLDHAVTWEAGTVRAPNIPTPGTRRGWVEDPLSIETITHLE